MNNSQGGIGAMAEDDHAMGTDLAPVPAEETPAARRPGAERFLGDEWSPEWIAEVRAFRVALDSMIPRLDAVEAAVLQAQGQQNQFEAMLPQYAQAINGLNARVTAIGQQVARNMRLAALDAAVKSGGPGLSAKQITDRAEMFLAWAEPPVAPGGSNSATHLGEERPPDAVSH